MGQLEPPQRRFQPSAKKKALDAAIIIRLLSAGTGGDPAAKGRAFVGLRIMAERVAARGELRFQGRPGDAGLEAGHVARGVQFQQMIHAAHVDGQHGDLTLRRVDVADHTCSAAVGNQPRPGLLGIRDQIAHLLFGDRMRDTVGEDRDASAAQGDPIGQALTAHGAIAPWHRSRSADAGADARAARRRRRLPSRHRGMPSRRREHRADRREPSPAGDRWSRHCPIRSNAS